MGPTYHFRMPASYEPPRASCPILKPDSILPPRDALRRASPSARTGAMVQWRAGTSQPTVRLTQPSTGPSAAVDRLPSPRGGTAALPCPGGATEAQGGNALPKGHTYMEELG